jgi:cytoskeleton protein RodZ
MSNVGDSSLGENLSYVDMGGQTGVDKPSGNTFTAGELLRHAREATGLHIAALAVALKVPVKKLEALEADRYDLLPDLVFARALASSVCRTLKIDAVPILECFPETNKPRLTYPNRGINAPFRASGDGPGPSAWTQVSRPAIFGGIALLLGALALVLWPFVQRGLGELRLSAIPEVASNAITPLFATISTNPEISRDSVKVNTASVDSLPATMATGMLSSTGSGSGNSNTSVMAVSAPLGVTATTGVATIPSPAAIEAPSVASSSPASASRDTVSFSAKGESWVEVTDARGQVILRRTLAPGEVAGVSGSLPFVAIVGRADATLVQVRGKPFDLNSFVKNNVARFEVK